MNPFDTVITLGGWCQVTSQARNYFSYTTAYPFDWGITTHQALVSLLDSDFEDFLNPANLKVRDDLDGVRCMKHNFIHMHDFLRVDHKVLPDIASQIEAAKSKYAYRFSNLRRDTEGKRVLFIRHNDVPVFNHHDESNKDHRRANRQDAEQILSALQTRFPSSDVVLLCVDFDDAGHTTENLIVEARAIDYCDERQADYLGSTKGWREIFERHGLQRRIADEVTADPWDVRDVALGYG